MGTLVGILLLLTAAAGVDAAPGMSHTVVVGDTFLYQVTATDTLATVSSRFGVPAATIRWLNALTPNQPIRAGDTLIIDRHHIAALDPGASLVLNVAQRMMFLVTDNGMIGYPVAVGLPGWATPRGRFTIVEKETNPVWDVPVSIQEEMRREGKPVVTRVPPGPNNPLGAYFIRLSFTSVGIHGTVAPSSIFRFATHGCIRMHPDDVGALFPRVRVGMRGTSIYEPVLLAVDGPSVLLEVHPDVYGAAPDPVGRIRVLAAALGATDAVDWTRVAEEVAAARGIAIEVSRYVGVD